MKEENEKMLVEETLNDINENCDICEESDSDEMILISKQEWLNMLEELKFTKMMLESSQQKNIDQENENETLRLRILHSEYNTYEDDSDTEY